MSEFVSRLRDFGAMLNDWRRELDWPLLAASASLLIIGLIMSLAAGPPAAERLGYSNPYFFVERQAIFALLGLIIILAVSVLPHLWIRRLAIIVFLASLMLLALIPAFGYEVKGAQRWFRLFGFSLQPTEFVKPALIVTAAWLLEQRRQYTGVPWTSMAVGLLVLTLTFLLTQPDVGQSALLTAAFIIMFFVSGISWRWAAGLFGSGMIVSVVLYSSLEYVRSRVHRFLFADESGTDQIGRSLEAIKRGGLFGVGPGEGQVKRNLPEAHNDFIYAVMSEEFGFISALALIAIYAFIIWRGLRLAARLKAIDAKAAVAGLFALFGLQAAINIAVNISLIPPKGMTLPFVSYGGTSILATALTFGFALALLRRSPSAWKGLG
ncbi:MAG: FtsW/RodA/SpoVE family cell cycle protein [Henriciella sp.]